MKEKSLKRLRLKKSKDKYERVEIKTGARDGEYTQIITDKIKEGDTVVTGRVGDEKNKDFMPKMRAL